MNVIRKIKEILNKSLEAVCAALLAFMSLLTVYQVFMRYVVKNPSTMSEDILSYSFVWLSLLAAALVFGERDHMSLTFFVDQTKPKIQLFLSVFSEVLILLVAALVFLFGGKGFMLVGAMQLSPTLSITMDWIYVILPVSGVLIILYSIINIAELVSSRERGERK
ncbi:TRAP transporter small permease [Clostridium sp. AM58-1XD]|uniref:TRAP transporter small permease n=1 Tax=Clostridium sp. AM58-1XD TaxID=2292307 RepID=UPI001FA82F05|nr:TRAP transporter small permease [Clostridium sp. AM58-1XD]